MANKKSNTKSKRPQRGADGLFHVQKYMGKHDDGTRCYKWFHNRNYNALLAEAAIAKQEFEAGFLYDDVHNPAPLTLDQAFCKYIDTCRALSGKDGDYSDSTIPGYESIRKNAFQDIMQKQIDKITVDDIQTYLDTAVSERTGKRKSVKTLRNEFYLLKPVMEKYAPDLNLKKIKIGKRKKKKLMVMRMADAPLILSAAKERHPEFFLYVLFTMVLGMRPSEVYALRWCDISAKPQVALVDQQKRLYGTVNVNKAMVMDENRRYTEKGTKTEAGERVLTHDWSLFETLYEIKPRGKASERVVEMTPRRQQYHWDLMRDELGLESGMRFYDLRHYHCSVMVASGAPEDYIAADMGHSTIQMAHEVYVELIEEKQQDINVSIANYTADLMGKFKSVASNATNRATKNEEFLSIAR